MADRPEAAAAGTVFSPDLVVFALEARRGARAALRLPAAPYVVGRWRAALVSQANDAPPGARELVSGHARHGPPLDRPHLAYVPLAAAGHPRADGRLAGLAAALPAALEPADRRAVLGVLARVGELTLGPLGVWALVPCGEAPPDGDLRPEAWTAHPGGATRWATVTPIAFDRHPRAARAGPDGAAATIAAACEAIGLPRPRAVTVTRASPHQGVPPASAFPRLARKDGGTRQHAHAILAFDAPVRGPVLLGAGRYRGYGVAKPIAGARP